MIKKINGNCIIFDKKSVIFINFIADNLPDRNHKNYFILSKNNDVMLF